MFISPKATSVSYQGGDSIAFLYHLKFQQMFRQTATAANFEKDTCINFLFRKVLQYWNFERYI